ncbi:Hypothetical protein PHPALM_37253 [Phytophthora palmivora]|uniref:Uncharacterized protein n=1 Tax=Phytophthora palmivora TaxID=4796 RepID=A0A2P4WXW0_9STRA|nr:Hypothetical protein PHPALM_37253 [Phytophthora palmivora]
MDGLYPNDDGPTAGALNAVSTALGAFLRFVTPQLLEEIAGECIDYFEENLDTHVEAQHTKQQARKEKRRYFNLKHHNKSKLICKFWAAIWLLIARTIALYTEKFAHYWKNSEE